MIKHLDLVNQKTGKQIDMGYDEEDYIIESIDWGTPEIEMQSYKIPFQLGTTLSGVSINSRKPVIYGYVVSEVEGLGMTWEEYERAQERQIEDKKLMLDDFISLYEDVVITAGEYNLLCRPTSPPKYSKNIEENNEVMCLFSIEFECYSPLFYKKPKTVALAVTEKKLHFPLPKYPDKIVFGEIKRQQSVLIENVGNTETGCEIRIEAQTGRVANPRIYNILTNEFIEFENVVLETGDYIIVNTRTGEEDAYKHISKTGENVSIVGDMKRGSKFLRIPKGSSYFGYKVADEYKNNVNMFITFTEQYFNLRGM